jgi:hypothetical protein
MAYLRERVAYLKGLAEGMQINDSTNEGKLLKAIIEVLDDVALAVDDVEEVQEQLSEQIDNIDEDLAEIERIIFDVDEYEDYDECMNEFKCPHCNESIVLDEEMLNSDNNTIECPNCHKDIEIEWKCDCENCDDKH